MRFLQREGGPWGGGGDDETPWGKPRRGRVPEGGGPQPPNFDDVLKKSQEHWKRIFPGGSGGFRKLFFLFLGVLLLWFGMGIFRVNEGEQGAVLRFGKWVYTVSDTGLHYHLPAPFESVVIRKVTEINRIDVGAMAGSYYQQKRQGFVSQQERQAYLQQQEGQAFMLTGDENILDVNMTIFWFIKELDKYLFRSADPEKTISIAADSVVREVIAQTPMELALTKGKSAIVLEVQRRLQEIADSYGIGIQIQKVDLQKVDAPPGVIKAFLEVHSARADKERVVNEALGDRDSKIPDARGKAEEIIKKAEGYMQEIIANAQGDSKRFNSVCVQYRMSPKVTKERLYLETMESVLENTQKIFVGQGAQGAIPYLPLPGFKAEKASESGERAP